jgi:hypothetical protein
MLETVGMNSDPLYTVTVKKNIPSVKVRVFPCSSVAKKRGFK